MDGLRTPVRFFLTLGEEHPNRELSQVGESGAANQSRGPGESSEGQPGWRTRERLGPSPERRAWWGAGERAGTMHRIRGHPSDRGGGYPEIRPCKNTAINPSPRGTFVGVNLDLVDIALPGLSMCMHLRRYLFCSENTCHPLFSQQLRG